MMNYHDLSAVELRKMCRERNLSEDRTWLASARRDQCIELLEEADNGEDIRKVMSLPPEPKQDDSLADILAKALEGRMRSAPQGIDEEAVRKLIQEETKDIPRVMQINLPEMTKPVTLTGQAVHRQLPQVLTWLRADVPVWLWGAPGAGKTFMGRQIAESMGIQPYVMSIDETTTANKLLGFQNLVSGDFVPGWLYEPFKNGGLAVIDEMDTGNPAIIAALNALLANGHYMFPNGETVERHKDFRVLACANTKGTGAIAGFTARQRLDAATLNRFAIVELSYDEGLELLLTCGVPSNVEPWKPVAAADNEDCKRWVLFVQKVRELANGSVLISPRASILGCQALRAGIPVQEVADALVFALMTADTVEAIIGQIPGGMDELIRRAA